jgi:periplasmic protein TonB
MPGPRATVAYLASAALHGALLAGLVAIPAPPRSEDVTVELVAFAPPPEAEPPPPAPERPEPPAPAEPAPAPRPVMRRAVAVREAPRPAPTPEPDAAPPPPNAEPPTDARPPTKAPVRIGISMSSATSATGIAAPAGNTMYGSMPRAAPEPGEVKPYRSERYVPPTEVTTLPQPVATDIPQSEYPREAQKLGLEGSVLLKLLVDENGRVVDAAVIQDPGHGFGPAAVESAKRRFRFEPARRRDEKVATWIRFTVRYELP